MFKSHLKFSVFNFLYKKNVALKTDIHKILDNENWFFLILKIDNFHIKFIPFVGSTSWRFLSVYYLQNSKEMSSKWKFNVYFQKEKENIVMFKCLQENN